LHFNGRFWDREDAEAQLDRAIVNTLKRRRKAAVDGGREAIVKAAKPSAHNLRGCKYNFRSLVTVSVKAFDQSPDHLNCANGVLDLRTGRLVPHSPAQRFTYCLPVEYKPQADQTAWLRFLHDATDGRPEMVRYLQLALGYSLTGHTREECMFYLYGPTRSGKGTFTETVIAMLGEKPIATEVDFGTFTASRKGDTQNFDLAPLKPCRFIAAAESKRNESLNAAKVKQITGGNYIRCAFKYRDHFEYRPQFKVWLASNHPVDTDVDDDAVWYRIRVIDFPRSHAGREDKMLKHRLRSPEVLRGVLAWAVEGARKWYAKGLETPTRVQEATNQARHDIDFVAQWLDECVDKTDGPKDFVANAVLYDSYHNWCVANGVEPEKKRSLTTALKAKGFKAGTQRKCPVTGRNRRGCVGIRLR